VERERAYWPLLEVLGRLLRAARPVLPPQLHCRLCGARWKPALGEP
jgi:hypothetical protein